MFKRIHTGWLAPAAVAATIVLVNAPAALAQATTPPKGSALRSAILDALRPMVEAEVGRPVEFVITDLNVLGEWAFVRATPQRKGGGEIAYAYTRYQEAYDAGAFDAQVTALLRDTPAGWLVYEYNLGATDVIWDDWDERHPVPPEVFP